MDNREKTDAVIPPLTGNSNADREHCRASPPKMKSTEPSSRIGFREFVPGAEYQSDHSDKESEPIVIPDFDLNQQMMASQRKQAATKRHGPGKQIDKTETQTNDDQWVEPGRQKVVPDDHSGNKTERDHVRGMGTIPKRNPLIAEIVRRDIERLCKPQQII